MKPTHELEREAEKFFIRVLVVSAVVCGLCMTGFLLGRVI